MENSVSIRGIKKIEKKKKTKQEQMQQNYKLNHLNPCGLAGTYYAILNP